MRPSPETYQPLQDWDELLDGVLARGRRLRSRRRLLATLPVVALLCAGASVTAVLRDGGDSGAARQVLTTVQPVSPAATAPATAGPVAPGPRAPGVHHSLTPGVAAGNPTTSSVAPGPPTAPPTASPAARPVLSYSDPQGDVTAEGIDSASHSSDITRMTFQATDKGLLVRMDLLGYQDDTKNHYLATLHSARSGCDLRITLDATQPGASAVCSGSTTWQLALSPYPDPTQLQVMLPWHDFPSQVSPREALSTRGDVTVADATGSGRVVTDSATDPRAVRFLGAGQ